MKHTPEQLYFGAVRDDMKMFLRHAFRTTTHPDTEFLDNWHIDAIIHALMETTQGRHRRVIVNLPPRYLKSFIVSVVWPAFILGHDPAAKIFCVSYTDEIAKVLARNFREIVESDWYRKIFPNTVLKKSNESEVVTTAGGGRYAISVGGSLTGRGADFIIIDDPIRPDDALSAKRRHSVNEWFRTTLLSRLDDKRYGVIVLVMQRLHVNDLTGFVQNDGYLKLSFPVVAEQDEDIPIGPDGEVYQRRKGELLHEEREDLQTLQALKNQMGSAMFAAQYQQRPDAPEGALIKMRYLNYLPRIPMSALESGYHWASIDSAASTAETADYTVITEGFSSRVDGRHYILSSVRGRWEYEDLKNRALKMKSKYPALQFIVEAASTGHSLLQYLLTNGILPTYHHHPSDAKMTRVARALPIFEDKAVWIVQKPGDNWSDSLVEELLTFPNGRHDDQVDSLVQAINYYDGRIRLARRPD